MSAFLALADPIGPVLESFKIQSKQFFLQKKIVANVLLVQLIYCVTCERFPWEPEELSIRGI